MEFLRKNKLLIILVIFIYLSLFLLNIYSTIAPDEYNYSHIVGSGFERVDSLKDIGTSMKTLYFAWTGRIPVHALISFLLYLGIPFYNILNPIVFLLFLIYIIKNASKKIYPVFLPILLFLLLFTTKAFGEDFIWLSGSLNYLWTSCAMIIFIFYLYKYILEDNKINKINLIGLLILSFFVGWSQEAVAFMVGSAIIILLITNFKKILKFKKSKIIILGLIILLFGIGAMLLIFAPGNFCRLDNSGTSIQIKNIIKNFYAIKYLIIFYIITVLFSLFIHKKSQLNSNNSNIDYLKILKKQFIYFLLPVAIALLPMLIIPEFSDRVMLPYISFILIALLYNLEYIIEYFGEQKYFKQILNIGFILVIILCSIKLGKNIWFSYKYIQPMKEKNILQIENAKKQGKTEIVVSGFNAYDKVPDRKIILTFFPDLIDNDIVNYYMARYYKVDKIQSVIEGNYIVEVKLSDESDENEIIAYDIVDKKTEKKVGERIAKIPHPVGENTILKRIIFTIPKDKLGDYVVRLPENIKKKIVNCVVKDTEDVKVVNIEEVVY